MFGWLITLLGWIGLVVLTLSFGSYALLHMINAYYFKTQNLQKRYNAEWALVTGASTGMNAPQVPLIQRQISLNLGCARNVVRSFELLSQRSQALEIASFYSTGIGKSIAEKLAKQKLNVVLVALDEPHLENTFRELKKNYPQQQFIKVRSVM